MAYLSILAYISVLLTMLCGVAGAPWWIAIVGGAVLAAIGIAEQNKLRPRLAAVGASEMVMLAGAGGVVNGCLAAGAAFGLGKFIGLVIL